MKRLSQSDLNSNKIVNVADPTAAQDAATKNYIDSTRTFIFDHVESGCVWTGDSYGSTRAASMSSGVVWIGGKRLTVAAVSARTFTASKDTYVGLIDAGNGTATVIYYDNTINTTSPTLATGGYTVLIAIIVTAAGNIASVASINQGQHNKVVPIISSVAMTTTDALGNLICPRDPQRRTLGYRQIIADTSALANNTQVPGLSCPVIIPTARKVNVRVYSRYVVGSLSAAGYGFNIYEGTVGAGTVLSQSNITAHANNAQIIGSVEIDYTPASTSLTYNTATLATSGTNTVSAASTAPAFIRVYLA